MTQSALKHPKFFNRYIEQVPFEDINYLLESSLKDLYNDLALLKNADFNFAYQSEKWSIAKLIRHCIDTEIIFGYRALCLARMHNKPIVSFNENHFAETAGNNFDKNDLLESFILSRKQNVLLFKSFDPSWMSRTTKTDNGEDISLAAIGYILIGHWLHHKHILSSRYAIQF